MGGACACGHRQAGREVPFEASPSKPPDRPPETETFDVVIQIKKKKLLGAAAVNHQAEIPEVSGKNACPAAFLR